MKYSASNLHPVTLLITASILIPVADAATIESAPPRELGVLRERIDAAFDSAEETGDFIEATIATEEAFDAVIAHVDPRHPDVFIEAAIARRLAYQLSLADPADAEPMLPYLRANPNFARALAFAAKPDEENMKEVYALANRLRELRGDTLDTYAYLAAAICLVHDKALVRRYNENRVAAPDPIELFDFYLSFKDRLIFDIRIVPTELLIYVVDATAPIEDLRWAVANYAGDRKIGRRFFDIKYDFEHFRTGAPKKSTAAGWGLPNIARYGGVCADQAYFAVTVGKAIGVPTAYTVGFNADVGHAWVGYLESDNRSSWWNFNEGRYGAYVGLKGLVFDPQVWKAIPDSYVSLLADFAMSRTEDRYTAAALTDAALRLIELETATDNDATHNSADDPVNIPPPWQPEALIETARSRNGRLLHTPAIKDELDLLEQGLRKSPGYAPGWLAIRKLAAGGRLELGHKKKWAEILSRLCGKRFPDFNLAILIPMIETVQDIDEQNAFWNRSFKQFSARPDLCSEIRMKQAEMWVAAGSIDKAGQCYMDVIDRYANAGPFVRDALKKAEQLLHEDNREDEIITLYADTWAKIKQPEQMAGQFAMQSNWYQVGLAYSQRLASAGMASEAQRVRGVIHSQ